MNHFVDISGKNEQGMSKANIVIQHNLCFADGKIDTLDEHIIYQKPIVYAYRDLLYTTVNLVFNDYHDKDLSEAWRLLSQVNKPENSVEWTPLETRRGVYIDKAGKEQPIFFHRVEVIIIPIGKENEYQMHGYHAITFHLCPLSTTDPMPKVLRLMFENENFVIADNLEVEV